MTEPWKNTSLQDIYGEEWKPIIGFEGNYEISSFGRVKALGVYNHPISIRKLSQHKNGYLMISLWKENREKRPLVHRLVAIHFIPNPESKSEVNHKKGIKTDNRATELEWVTTRQNHLHAFRELGKKNPIILGADNHRSKPVIQFSKDGLFIKRFVSVTYAARSLGGSISKISAACLGRQKTSGGFKWKYA
jgi:hypothetical protein